MKFRLFIFLVLMLMFIGAAAIIPVIDMSRFFNGSAEDRQAIGDQLAKSCAEIGFFALKGHNVPQSIIDNMWHITREFFDLDLVIKAPLELDQNVYPFGYTKLGGEVLSSGKSAERTDNGTAAVINELSKPDLKEMFSIGPKNPLAGFPARIFPDKPETFADIWDLYYESLSSLATSLLEAFALGLHLPEDYFMQFTDSHASALRALNYPELRGCEFAKNQYRASAHTDYGIFTILRADSPGLQVSKDRNPPTWIDVPVVTDGFIVNIGDLMKRWTNDKFLSTLHQVVIKSDDLTNTTNGYCTTDTVISRRQSIAFFYNVNKDAVISNLNVNEESKYDPIVAGDFLLSKHLAAMRAGSS